MAFRSRSNSDLNALPQRPDQGGAWFRFRTSPTKFLAQYVYSQRSTATLSTPETTDGGRISVVCISDTHNTKPSLPDGDILIHAGDLTQSGTRSELEQQIDWLDAQPHRYKIVIAGNHELCLDANHPSNDGKEDTRLTLDWKSLIYLENTSRTIRFADSRVLRIFGSPHTPKHGNWAFQYPRAYAGVWDDMAVPEDTDVLITHGPPKAHLDLGHLGCQSLRQTLWSMKRRPLLHVFGHIHGGYGKEIARWDTFQRAYEAIMDEHWIWLNLIVLVYCWILGISTGWAAAGKQETVMVNAAAVGGVRDEKRREAICVDL
ncbi:uncharacterized protein DSM5745_00736 [Aspergillus mulundensis]|uniref:Calcineurin-like phosphoesterase domain-containing protein n=1 Tax=Aspergillus mulundensis TaxID=1810919 RepID=A0A3D8T4H7_9EURO|nr:Uncharacterized protein DSM5745_00736 [Aspergillus mulundensis]RDW93414.1 Uncharacterized protein DSM5745_00736 [Aspergillus mulundensis]